MTTKEHHVKLTHFGFDPTIGFLYAADKSNSTSGKSIGALRICSHGEHAPIARPRNSNWKLVFKSTVSDPFAQAGNVPPARNFPQFKAHMKKERAKVPPDGEPRTVT